MCDYEDDEEQEFEDGFTRQKHVLCERDGRCHCYVGDNLDEMLNNIHAQSAYSNVLAQSIIKKTYETIALASAGATLAIKNLVTEILNSQVSAPEIGVAVGCFALAGVTYALYRQRGNQWAESELAAADLQQQYNAQLQSLVCDERSGNFYR